jgi:hypothetical protein
MKTLIIKDLDRTEQLDRSAMATVRGGWSMYMPSFKTGDLSYAPNYDSSINAAQNLGQMQNVMTATANGSAFLDHVDVHSKVHQNGQNKIVR